MKTIDEMVSVMTAFMNGAKVEYKELYLNEQYKTIENENMTLWNWADYDYRIKEQKKTVTIEKWLMKAGDKKSFFIAEGDKSYLENYNSQVEKVRLLETYEVKL